jgi:hypothetical protein
MVAAFSQAVRCGVAKGESPGVDYARDIKPLLKERCYACHGALDQEAGLRVDTAALLRQGGDSGSAITAGDPAKSLLIARITDPDDATRMPPEGERLTEAQVDKLKAWITQGAVAPTDEQAETDPAEHWAFRPIARPPVPRLDGNDWIRNPIDAFVAARHQELGLEPQTEASRSTLIRRLYLDLIGLPPTAKELAEIGKPDDPGWYERLVRTLLDDPRHGQRWARHWMDVWRYSDWWGLGSQLRNSQYHMWHWRDWIVESLNDDVPYDEMVRLMLAADELAPDDPKRLRATGFLARNYFLFNRHQWMDETVEHVSKGLLGLTMNCSKCHDHKYDPFRQTDYYRMRAFFEPYHVRLDVVPGEVDLDRDGIPRVFDAFPDDPTYLFIRGEENRPDKERTITPGLPEILSKAPLPIDPVKLPADAWDPQRRPWVFPAYLDAKRKEVAGAEKNVAAARDKVTAADRVLAEWLAKPKPQPPDPNTVAEHPDAMTESFATLDPQRWKTFGGQWSHEAGKLQQKQDGPNRAALVYQGKPTRDLDVSLRFTIHGGSQWRSVGISLDATRPDPAGPPVASDDELFIYASAYAGGPKVHAAYRHAGRDIYPPESFRPMPIEVDRPYTLSVQIRDTLVNVSLDGNPLIAWRSPRPRQDGAIAFTTFDALATFHEIKISPLDPQHPMREATGTPNNAAPTSVEEAKRGADVARAEAELAHASLATLAAELDSLTSRSVALRAKWDWERTAPAGAKLPEDVLTALAAAHRAQQRLAIAREIQKRAEARVRWVSAGDDKRAAIEKELADHDAAIATAKSAWDRPVDPEAALPAVVGAKWTPTRFRSSGADDPAPTFPETSTGRRTALARWITDPRNPLTARVAVNHIWMRHLGEPLVPTVFDFGRQGTPPANQALLDWLASELIDSGWSMKHIHQLIVLSSTYRLGSSLEGREKNVEIDRDNRYLWRRSPIRLESQVVRDSVLALAGTLDTTFGGPSVPSAAQADSKRRSLYFFHSNNERDLFLTTFDEAAVTECYRRDQSVVPQQALALINSRLVLEAAEPIAQKVAQAAAEGPGATGPGATGSGATGSGATGSGTPDPTDEAFARAAFDLLLGSSAEATEVAACVESLTAWRAIEGVTPDQARANLIWALLNHNDFVTLR